MFSSCNPTLLAVRHTHYPVSPSIGHFHTDTVLPPSDHYCIDTVAPSGDRYYIDISSAINDRIGTQRYLSPLPPCVI